MEQTELRDMDDAAHPKTWRAWFMALCAFTATLVVVETLLYITVLGTTGLSTAPTRVPFVHRVMSAPPGSLVHAGDVIDFRAVSAAERWNWAYGDVVQGQSFALTVVRNTRPVHVTVVAGPARYFGAPVLSLASWPYWLAAFGQLWMLGFAALIAWRRPASREARVLALLLVLTSLGVVLYNWSLGPPPVTTLLYAVGTVCYSTGGALLATYAMLFKPASRVRTLLAWSTYALFFLNALRWWGWPFAWWTMAIDPSGALLTGPATQLVTDVLPYVVPVVCGAWAIAETRGQERARLSWTIASLALLYLLGNAFAALVRLIFPGHENVVFMLGNTALFIAPLGLTYGLLNRKLLDVGFALNRAAVFTGVSVVVVGIFVLVEWAFGEWLQGASHAANVAASGSLALVLGLSVRFVHGRVEHVIDNVFFRKRHEDEGALRAFAHEAGYISDPDTLIARTVAVIERHADASNAQLAIDDGTGHYGDVNEDDSAIVALRAWNKPLDLHGVETALRGDMAFPMVARGRLVGALVLGPKRSGETYAPDETDAILQIAHSVGTSLAVLDRKPAFTYDAADDIRAFIREAQSCTANEISALRTEIRALGQQNNGAWNNEDRVRNG